MPAAMILMTLPGITGIPMGLDTLPSSIVPEEYLNPRNRGFHDPDALSGRVGLRLVRSVSD